MKFKAKIDLSKLRNVLANQGTDIRAPNVNMHIDMNRSSVEVTSLYDQVWEVVEECKEEDDCDAANDFQRGDLDDSDRAGDVRELALQSYPDLITYVSFRIGRAFVRLHPHREGGEVWIDGPKYRDYVEADLLKSAFCSLTLTGLIHTEKSWNELFLEAVEAYRADKLREVMTLSKTVEEGMDELAVLDGELAALRRRAELRLDGQG